MNEYITLEEVKRIWTIPGKKPPSTATIWHRRRAGLIPQPKLWAEITCTCAKTF